MEVAIRGEPPEEIRAWLDERRRLGQDGYDEVWDGVYVVAPPLHGRHGRVGAEVCAALHEPAASVGLLGGGAVNIGRPSDYRVPDAAYFRTPATALWNPTAAIVVEVLLPADRAREKLGFYIDAGVDEMLIVDPGDRTVEWFVGGVAAARSRLLDVTAEQLRSEIEWPE